MRKKFLPMLDAKRCRDCGEVKAFDDFHRASEMRDGRSNRCKECQSVYCGEYREANESQIAAGQARWYDRNRERILRRQRSYYEMNRVPQLERRRR